MVENLYIAYDHMIMSKIDSSFSSLIIEYKRKKRQPLSRRCVGDHIANSNAHKKKERADFSLCLFVRLSERVQSDYPSFFSLLLSSFSHHSSSTRQGEEQEQLLFVRIFFSSMFPTDSLTYSSMVLHQVKILNLSRFTS